MRVGILGGTFDPIHAGHLLIAEQAIKQVRLDEVWFVPAKAPPHKAGQNITSINHRVKMVQLAILSHPYFRLSEIELMRPGPSYTVDTVNLLVQSYPNIEFYLIMGADTVKDLPNWHKIKEIIKQVEIIGVYRPSVNVGDLPQWIKERLIWIQEEIGIHVSSTYIRENIADHHLLQYVLPNNVYQYIKENRLYAN